ncbi:MAG: hypothetical protein HWN67_18580, partial [Candidatus Helarchaeota archaeon]|nr:hypothetical protein [Candidatus Helarchaeota archaeon]
MKLKRNKSKILTFVSLFTILIISASSLSTLNSCIRIQAIENSAISSSQIILGWENNGEIMCNISGTQDSPQICSDGTGGAIITWRDTRGITQDIYAQRVDSEGNIQWGNGSLGDKNGTIICNANDHQSSPQICSDGAGGAIIVWQDLRGATDDIYAQRVNSTGNVNWTSNGVLICNPTFLSFDNDPQICSDGEGGAIITWQNSSIFAQRVNSSGHLQWTNEVSICSASNMQDSPQICSDGAGGAIITWEDDRVVGTDIYAQRVNSTGDIEWTIDGVVLCNESLNQNVPQICSDGVGGAIITWEDQRTGTDDIYSQRISSSGVVNWTVNGTAISTESSNAQRYPQICGDGMEGAIITWVDYRTDGFGDIYAQRVSFNGITQWINNGTVICNALWIQNRPKICIDGAGGAVITWYDDRIGQDIYAQWINSSGNVTGTPNGMVICNATSSQDFPEISSDGAGGAIITWQDDRGVDEDIYAQKISTPEETPEEEEPGLNPILLLGMAIQPSNPLALFS